MRLTKVERMLLKRISSHGGKRAWANIPPEKRSEILRERAMKRYARQRREREQQLQEA
jgi:hypothetical protein